LMDTAGEVGFYAFSPGAEAPGYTAAPDESGLQAPLMGRCYVAWSLELRAEMRLGNSPAVS
jgi:hypothetical protein